MTRSFAWRDALSGLFVLGAISLVITAGTASFWPGGPVIGTFARMADGMAPQLILMAMLCVVVLAILRARKVAVLGCAAAIAIASGFLTLRHLALALPIAPAATPVVSVLWFNVLHENPVPADRLIEALARSDADVIFLAEASPLYDHDAELAEHFPTRTPCMTPRCPLKVLARDPAVEIAQQQIGRMGEPRLATVRLDMPGYQPLTLVGAHLFKPWFFGVTESEEQDLVRELRRHDGPLILAGDLNAAPWSDRLLFLARACALAFPRLPVPTWPAGLGLLGVPIDHVLVRDGARLHSLQRWGSGLGSNHAGLLAGIAVPSDTASQVRNQHPDCAPR